MAKPGLLTFDWTDDAERTLLELRDDEGMLWDAISAEIGASAYACETHYRRLKSRARIEAGGACAGLRAPNSTIIDRDNRDRARLARDEAALQRGNVTPIFFGDPPPGYSELDKRRGV